MEDKNIIIKIDHVNKFFDIDGKSVQVLKDINFISLADSGKNVAYGISDGFSKEEKKELVKNILSWWDWLVLKKHCRNNCLENAAACKYCKRAYQ